MYAIGQLITQVIGRDKKKKRQIVEKLGYKKLNKGYRRLGDLIRSGSCSKQNRQNLPEALGISPEVVEQAFEDTYRQIRAEQEAHERETFYPHIFDERELSQPTSIVTLIATGAARWKKIRLPEDIAQESWSEQERIVRETIQTHQENPGGPFGLATGYVYRPTYDDSVTFSTEGEMVDRQHSREGDAKVYLTIGGKKLER